MNESTKSDYSDRLYLCGQILKSADAGGYMSQSLELAQFTGENFLTILESWKKDDDTIEIRVEGLILEVKKALDDLKNGKIKSGISKLEIAIHGNIHGKKTFSNLLPYFPPPPRY